MMSVEDRLKAAARHRTTGDWASAAALLESILDDFPGHCRALIALADIRLEEGNGEAARVLLDEVLRQDRTSDESTNLRTTLLINGQHRDDGKKVEETLDLPPAQGPAKVLHAGIHLLEKEHAQADRQLRQALDDRADDDPLICAFPNLYAQLRDDCVALSQAQRALPQAPNDVHHLARAGFLSAGPGDHSKAVALLEQAHLKRPAHPLVMLYLAESQAALGLFQEARTLAMRLTVRFPEHLAGWLLLIQIEAKRGDTRKVFADFLLVTRRHPDKTAALIALAMAYRKLGYLSKPARLLRPLLEPTRATKAGHRIQARTVLRDCMLASDNLEDLHKAMTMQTGNADAPTQAGQSAIACPSVLLQSLAGNDVLIDPGLSGLEALVLLRFASRPSTSPTSRTLVGPPHLKPLQDLLTGFRFQPIDGDTRLQAPTGPTEQTSLLSTLSLPPPVLRRVRQTGAYLFPDPSHQEKWQDALRDLPRPLIGLAWNETRAGLMLEDYQPLLDRLHGFDGTFLGVVRDNSRHQLKDLPRVVDCGRRIASLTDLSALVSQVDLLIGPDGLPTHVAGAQNRPAILLTQPAHPWYWHARNGRSTWYPSVQVICTRKFGHWSSLMTEVSDQIVSAIGALQTAKSSVASN